MKPEDAPRRPDPLIDLAARAPAAPDGSAGEEMDPNDIAQLAAGAPGADSRDVLERRAAAGPSEDRSTVAAVAAAAPQQSVTREARKFWWLPMSAAALVLAALGAAWLSHRAPESDIVSDVQLAKAFEALRSQAPDVFRDLTPINATERKNAKAPVHRGGIRVFEPAGVLLSRPAEFRWDSIEGAESYELQVLSDDGSQVVHTTTAKSTHPWPNHFVLTPGTSYVATVSSLVGGVRVRGSAAFHSLDAQSLVAYRGALKAIDAQPKAIRPLLRAHVAARRGLIQEARRYADQAAASPSAEALAHETRAYLDRLYPTR